MKVQILLAYLEAVGR